MLDIILMVVAVLLILLSLLQGGKTEGASGALTGSAGVNLFANTKERGTEKFISNLTMVVGISFFVLVLIARI
ncbi:MAG: preprotein translocase subunit SecG, partial [Erysipelotrichaceae bacterium]|nr:preprotein translocase subunit SecG [Erysipelotrichaceae bacterium]